MPKIGGTYTPLLPCIDHALTEEKLFFREVSAEEQALALDALRGPEVGRKVFCEPSSIAPFAVLPRIASELLHGTVGERVLIIISGLGLLSAAEQNFLYGHVERLNV